VDNSRTPEKRKKPLLTHVIDPKLRKGFNNYLLQSLIATGICCIMLISLDVIITGALVASLGASTFIVFVAPDTRSAKPRGLLGGQLIGTGTGLLCWFLLDLGTFSGIGSHRIEVAIFGSIAVGLAIFLMVTIDMEHPPAAGTALSLVMSEWSCYSILFIGGASLFLSFARWLLGKRLKNLY
jgi:CBS-domain-containing membrane protein